MRPIFLSLILCICFTGAQAQRISDLTDIATNEKLGSALGEGISGGGYSGNAFFADLFLTLFVDVCAMSVYHAQVNQLNRAPEEPWRISFEAKARTGFNFNEVEYFDQQMVRGNWGLISSELRRSNLHDVTGNFTTIDWQIIQFNLINIEAFRWLVGLGISHEVQVNQTHPEFSTEFQVRLWEDKFMPSFNYRFSDDAYPRQEVSAQVEYKPFVMKHIDLGFSLGYMYQRLYGLSFNFPSAGLSFNWK